MQLYLPHYDDGQVEIGNANKRILKIQSILPAP